ncbi:MAG: hypothetical protein AAGC63_16115 [Propionicimonas sp.]
MNHQIPSPTPTPTTDAIRDALLSGEGAAKIVNVYFAPYPYAVQVTKKGRKVGPLIFPSERNGIDEVFCWLGALLNTAPAVGNGADDE